MQYLTPGSPGGDDIVGLGDRWRRLSPTVPAVAQPRDASANGSDGSQGRGVCGGA